MTDVIWMGSAEECFCPIDRWVLMYGELFRLPDGRVFRYVFDYPNMVNSVDSSAIPEGVEIVEMVAQSQDTRFCYGPSNEAIRKGARILHDGRVMGRVDGGYSLGKDNYLRFPDGKMELIGGFGIMGNGDFGAFTKDVELKDVPMGSLILDMFYLDEYEGDTK